MPRQRLAHRVAVLVARHAADGAAEDPRVVAAPAVGVLALARVVGGGAALGADDGARSRRVAAVAGVVSEEPTPVAGDVRAAHCEETETSMQSIVSGRWSSHTADGGNRTCFVVPAGAEVARRGDGVVGALELLVAHLAAGLALEGQVVREVAGAVLAPRHSPLRVRAALRHTHGPPAATLTLQRRHARVHINARGQLRSGGSRRQVFPFVKTHDHIGQVVTQLGGELHDLWSKRAKEERKGQNMTRRTLNTCTPLLQLYCKADCKSSVCLALRAGRWRCRSRP